MMDIEKIRKLVKEIQHHAHSIQGEGDSYHRTMIRSAADSIEKELPRKASSSTGERFDIKKFMGM